MQMLATCWRSTWSYSFVSEIHTLLNGKEHSAVFTLLQTGMNAGKSHGPLDQKANYLSPSALGPMFPWGELNMTQPFPESSA